MTNFLKEKKRWLNGDEKSGKTGIQVRQVQVTYIRLVTSHKLK